MRVLVSIQVWTAVYSQRKIYRQSFLRKLEIAVAALQKGKFAGVDNIPAELVQAGTETMTDVLTKIFNKIWKTGEGLSH